MTTEHPQRAHLSTRQKARKRAVDILFEADLRDVDVLTTLSDRTVDDTPPIRAYTAEIVRGFAARQAEVDQRICECLSIDWSLERMPRVDRAIARVAMYELDHGLVPQPVAVAEATQLARDLSTDESPAFLNGLLSQALATSPRRAGAEPQAPASDPVLDAVDPVDEDPDADDFAAAALAPSEPAEVHLVDEADVPRGAAVVRDEA